MAKEPPNTEEEEIERLLHSLTSSLVRYPGNEVHPLLGSELEIAARDNPKVPLRPDEIETIKLRANYLNGMAIALFAVGALAPVVKVFDGSTQSGLATAAVAIICIFLSHLPYIGARPRF